MVFFCFLAAFVSGLYYNIYKYNNTVITFLVYALYSNVIMYNKVALLTFFGRYKRLISANVEW
jgi:hypothetical protein